MNPTPLLLALALAAPAQDAAPPAVEDEGWREFDGVAAIVNDEIVTLRELDRALLEALENAEVTTDEERLALRDEVIYGTLLRRLETQAGARLGIPRQDVERTIDRYLDEERRDRTPTQTTAWMRDQGVDDLEELRESIRDEIYRTFWRQHQVGIETGADRPFRDRYVRPGQLLEAYVVNRDEIGEPARVVLQDLVLPAVAWGDEAAAREAAEGLLARVEAGEDMGALVDEYGASLRETRGVTPWLVPTRIEDPGVRAFAVAADEGALSEVLPIVGPDGAPSAWHFVRLVSRLEGTPPPPFQDRDLQSRLQRMLQESWDLGRVEDADSDLWRAAFILTPASVELAPPWARRRAAR